MMRTKWMRLACAAALVGALATGCEGADGAPGMDGRDGVDGMDGTDGTNGTNGADGMDGMDGTDGADGADGTDGRDYDDTDDLGTFVTGLVNQVAAGTLPATVEFPLAPVATDSVRAVAGVTPDPIVNWLDPLTFSAGNDAPYFGANADYVAYFGDGWNTTPGQAPQWHGSGRSGWLWVNHEYISNNTPTTSRGPTGQHFTFASWLRSRGILTNDIASSTWAAADIDTYARWSRRQLGGSWIHIVQDPATRRWSIDRSATNLRFDASDRTRFAITGITRPSGADRDDTGAALPAGVTVGTLGNCSGGQTPWGTIITAEENVQSGYGSLDDVDTGDTCWSSRQFYNATRAGCAPGTAFVFPTTPASGSEFGRDSDPNRRHARDNFGYIVEIDPTVPASEYYGQNTPGVGHRKLGAIGRATWENATFATDENWALRPGQPIVMYMGDDRRSGRIYRFVSAQPYTAGMTRAQIRALLDDGTLYVAHFADLAPNGYELTAGGGGTEAAPGNGRWVELSFTSTDVAPNGAALGNATITVGAALANQTWNHMAGFTSDDQVRLALFTASTKIGIRELNRPEDIEWNPRDPSGTPTMYVTFTNNTRPRALQATGELYQFADAATHAAMAFNPNDAVGSIFAIREQNPANPAASTTFTFWRVWRGSEGSGPYDAANPDNLVIDAQGRVWFGTDGNFGTNDHADAVYYLDLDPAHRTTATATYGRAFRVFAVPSDAEATGPAFSSDMRTFFLSVQHPGEDAFSSWPGRSFADAPRSGVVAFTRGIVR